MLCAAADDDCRRWRCCCCWDNDFLHHHMVVSDVSDDEIHDDDDGGCCDYSFLYQTKMEITKLHHSFPTPSSSTPSTFVGSDRKKELSKVGGDLKEGRHEVSTSWASLSKEESVCPLVTQQDGRAKARKRKSKKAQQVCKTRLPQANKTLQNKTNGGRKMARRLPYHT